MGLRRISKQVVRHTGQRGRLSGFVVFGSSRSRGHKAPHFAHNDAKSAGRRAADLKSALIELRPFGGGGAGALRQFLLSRLDTFFTFSTFV